MPWLKTKHYGTLKKIKKVYLLDNLFVKHKKFIENFIYTALSFLFLPFMHNLGHELMG
jgi:phage-related protein